MACQDDSDIYIYDGEHYDHVECIPAVCMCTTDFVVVDDVCCSFLLGLLCGMCAVCLIKRTR